VQYKVQYISLAFIISPVEVLFIITELKMCAECEINS